MDSNATLPFQRFMHVFFSIFLFQWVSFEGLLELIITICIFGGDLTFWNATFLQIWKCKKLKYLYIWHFCYLCSCFHDHHWCHYCQCHNHIIVLNILIIYFTAFIAHNLKSCVFFFCLCLQVPRYPCSFERY